MKNISLFLLFAVAILSGAELAVILTTVSPYSAGQTALWTFFVSLFLCLTTTLSLLLFAIRTQLSYYRTPSLFVSVRQVGIGAALVVLCLFFNSLSILSLWEIIPLAISAVLIELFFQADKSASNSNPA